MKKQLTKLALTAALGLAITLTFTACEEKKKQDGTTPTATEPAEAAATQEDSQEAAAADEPKFFECGDTEETEWRMGLSNDNCTRLVASSKKYTRAVSGSQMPKIKYIGKKKERREEREMDFYFASYETSCGFEYEIINYKGKECVKTFFLYNDSEKWGGVPNNIVFKNEGKYPRLKASKDEIAAMEKLQNGRKIILSEVIADFSIEGKSNRLMLVRYKNTKEDGMFQIVLRDHNNDYFTADYPSQLFDGEPNWRADMGDEIGEWSLYFVGKIAEYLFLVTDWCAAEGCGITHFVAKNGKLLKKGNPPITLTDTRDSQIYFTAKIDEQVWMAENLNYNASGSKCYNNEPANCAKYGRLYDWNTAMKACPSGWHLPSKEEWGKLFDYADKYGTPREILKAEDGFTALPGGCGGYCSIDNEDDFNFIDYGGYWWSATEKNSDYADSKFIPTNDDESYHGTGGYKSNLLSVRCIKD